MMNRKLCIHGHFYQPPREDPWFGKIFIEGSAAPLTHWNERITRESYAPLAWARRLDAQGRIADLMNCYEWISFNIGPTLMIWLERQAPELLERIVEADRLSFARWGHGNAIAQAFHHIILPLASDLDKEIEIAWALDDFRHRFGRESEGIWLAECAVDIATLEVVAANGIKFVVLSPHQARFVRENGQEQAVDANNLNYGRHYRVALPSGRSVFVFFYEAGLAQAVAFNGLLSDGEKFWQHIRTAADKMPNEEGILTLATDGETYGHHFTFGEMALAYVLAQGYSGRDGIKLTNFGAYLAEQEAESAPVAEVVLHNPSSWSCAHGVERWRSNCGCSTGGHNGWSQEWRSPLRDALNLVKKNADKYFFSLGESLFTDAKTALLNYGAVLVKRESGKEFAKKYFKPKILGSRDEMRAWMLLRMQDSALSSFASCAWFFDEISRIEPVNAMRFALLAMKMLKLTGAPSIASEFENILEQAKSNIASEGNGKDIFKRRVLPSSPSPASILLFACLHAYATGRLPDEGKSTLMDYPSLSVKISLDNVDDNGRSEGTAIIAAPESIDGIHYAWSGFLPLVGKKNSISISDSSIELISTQNSGAKYSCVGSDLVWYLKDFLSVTLMQTVATAYQKSSLSVARAVISTAHKYAEGQSVLNRPELWQRFAVYVPLAVYSERFDEEALEQASVICSTFLTESTLIEEARKLLELATLRDLSDATKGDFEISEGILRVQKVFKNMDWWRIQNALWKDGNVNRRYAASASALGFRLG